MILGVDPGPTHCGVVLYDDARRRAVSASAAAPLQEVLDHWLDLAWTAEALVAIELVQSYGIAGASLLQTSEVVGRLQQRALDNDLPVRLLYRREVLRALDVTGLGNRDAMIRQRLLEIHGGTRQVACGTKRAPGPLYGITSHAWQALAVAVAAMDGAGDG